ncbi:hypothetical protein AYI69_g635 [Smittium culicis]|uniref:Uncharacterized protein n=1 Tax=Smittium culicis TaxID=133412 RepID=A0A1R1YSJ4_9FUNG|nr:hypothetical protein AYI69_g635 [Smittium culicis]
MSLKTNFPPGSIENHLVLIASQESLFLLNKPSPGMFISDRAVSTLSRFIFQMASPYRMSTFGNFFSIGSKKS